uniref:Protein kinase domain-containing protein n=1 Tax=Amphimedon queenslandica TaxID=400682 RepID=A0A1X7VM39_AMPQE
MDRNSSPLPTREYVLSLLKDVVLKIQSTDRQLTDVVIPQDIYDLCRRFVEEKLFEDRYENHKVFEILQQDSKELIASEAEVNKMKNGLKSLLRYPLNLLVAPNRPEVKIIKASTSFFMFHVKRNLKDARAFLGLMGYDQARNATDLSLNKSFSIDRVYTLVLDIVILHEELEIISHLISQSMPSDVKFYHYFIARRYGPSNKWDCLDYIMKGKAAAKASYLEQVKGFVKETVFSCDDYAAEEGVRFEAGDASNHKSKFKEGDRVILQTVKEEVVAGTVRWVGPVRISKDMKIDPLPVVGIETDTKIDPIKDFDGVDINITGSHGTKLFKVPYNHSRVFLPEQMVLFVSEYTMQMQKDAAAKFKKETKMDDATEEEKRSAAEFGMTVAEYRRQQQGYVDVAKQGKDGRKVPGDPKIGEEGNEEKFAPGGGMMGVVGGGRGVEDELMNTIQAVQFSKPGAVDKKRVEREEIALQGIKSKQQQQQQENHELQRGQRGYYEVIEGGIEECIVEDSLKEEIHQLQTSIENLQLEKDTQQRRAEQQEQQWRNEKQQLLEEQEHLRELIKQVQEQLETDKQALKEEIGHLKYENGQLKYENEDLRREISDLREAHRELQQETEKKEQVQAQLQSQVGLFSIENMRLKGQVKQLEESSATDIKYWEVSYKQVLTNKDTLGSGGWGKVEVGLLHGQKVAVKMLHSDIKSPYYNQLVRREISMLAKVRHPNLLLFIAGVLDHPSGSPIIITELLDTSLRKAYTDRLIGSDR